MAYQDTISPAEVLDNEIKATRTVFDKIVAFFESVGFGIQRAAMARARFHTVQVLRGMSDAQLAELNIKREDIVKHVFNDLYYS